MNNFWKKTAFLLSGSVGTLLGERLVAQFEPGIFGWHIVAILGIGAVMCAVISIAVQQQI